MVSLSCPNSLFAFLMVCCLPLASIVRGAEPDKKDEPAKVEDSDELIPQKWAAQIEKDLIAGMREDRKKAKVEFEKDVADFTAQYPNSPYLWNFKVLRADFTLTSTYYREAV